MEQLFDKLERCDTLNRRIRRGGAAWRQFFHNANACHTNLWLNIGQALLFLVMLPMVIPMYLAGWLGEWREDRRDGITSVRD